MRATLSAARAIEALTVRNDGAEPAVVQLELMSWTQQDGKDVYAPTKEIIATPPLFTVPPGGSQIVRVGLRRAPDRERELAYRIYLQEVPGAPKPGFQGLQVALRIGVPVFVNPPSGAKPLLQWTLTRGGDGGLRLAVANNGNAHVQVASFALAAGSGTPIAAQQVSTYVLPGQRREWPLKTSQPIAAGTPVQLRAQTDAGDVTSTLAVDKP